MRGRQHQRQRRAHAYALLRTRLTLHSERATAQARTGLHAAQALWREVLEATHQGAWEYDVSADALHHSRLWRSLFGYADEPQGHPLEHWLARIHPEDTARVRMAMRAHLAGTTPFYESLHRLRDSNGHYHWILDRGKAVRFAADGAATRIIGTKLEASQRQLFQQQLDQLADNVPGMLYQFQMDADGHLSFPYVSDGAREVYELTPEQLQADASLAFARLHPHDHHLGLLGIRASARTLGNWQSEYRVNLPERGERWLSGCAKPQPLEHGAVLWHGYLRDITHDKQRELKLHDTERLLQRLLNDMPMALVLVDADGQFYFRNRRFQDMFGFREDLPLTLAQWWQTAYPDPAYRNEVIAQWHAAIAEAKLSGGEIPKGDFHVHLHDGSECTMAIGGLAFGDHFMATFEDRTAQLAQTEHLQQLAYVDGLTGISNRRRFDDALRVEWRRCLRSQKPLALLMIDIDHFKAYNDQYGHLQGDACLQTVASALHGCLHRAQDLVARYGGEEFVCLLPECDLSGAQRIAEAMRQAVQALALPHASSPVAPTLTISVGVACEFPRLLQDSATLLADADAQLYRAKQAGRNRVCAVAANTTG